MIISDVGSKFRFQRVISGLRRGVKEICVLLGCSSPRNNPDKKPDKTSDVNIGQMNKGGTTVVTNLRTIKKLIRSNSVFSK